MKKITIIALIIIIALWIMLPITKILIFGSIIYGLYFAYKWLK